jgi:SAM-dependent methyltransferase
MSAPDVADVNNPFFSRVWTFLSAHETEAVKRLRRENLAGLSGRVLEVGAGTGTNFAYYPATVDQVVAVEPEPHLLVHARHAAAASAVPVSVTGQTVETFSDARPFDAVVCSLVLFTVEDAESVVQQLFAALKPGGELHYMEHVASAGWRGRMQRAADAMLWPKLFGNCHTHRDTEHTLTGAGFRLDTARRDWVLPTWLPLPSVEFALGRAVKPA